MQKNDQHEFTVSTSFRALLVIVVVLLVVSGFASLQQLLPLLVGKL